MSKLFALPPWWPAACRAAGPDKAALPQAGGAVVQVAVLLTPITMVPEPAGRGPQALGGAGGQDIGPAAEGTGNQCCGSEIIFFGSGSGYDFSRNFGSGSGSGSGSYFGSRLISQ